ncbi:hypothetical protein CSPX01_16470 [Colletotrichum filicis]|nr:hypothetical protein CSPX01_16470 [Colletotrichum filicis]
MRHAWLDFKAEEAEEVYAGATVKVFEALSLDNEPSFEELVSSDSLYSTLWARPEQSFCFDPISSDSSSLSHGNSMSGMFTVIQMGASAPFNPGTLIDQELDRVIGKDIRCRNNPEFLRLKYFATYGHRIASDELHTFSIRDRCLINQINSDMDGRGQVTYVLRAAVRLQQNVTDGLDQVQLFTQSGEVRWDWRVADDWLGNPGYTWFLLYWKTNPGYRVGGPSAELAEPRIEENSEGTQDESRIARAYGNRHEGKYMQNPIGYPWTKYFAMEIWKITFKDANKQFWLTYDYSKDSENQSRLQVDPMTRDWQTALQNEALILKDQMQHGWKTVEYLHY